jgi:hypothetical protein
MKHMAGGPSRCSRHERLVAHLIDMACSGASLHHALPKVLQTKHKTSVQRRYHEPRFSRVQGYLDVQPAPSI